jgi:hypothetical protein
VTLKHNPFSVADLSDPTDRYTENIRRRSPSDDVLLPTLDQPFTDLDPTITITEE